MLCPLLPPRRFGWGSGALLPCFWGCWFPGFLQYRGLMSPLTVRGRAGLCSAGPGGTVLQRGERWPVGRPCLPPPAAPSPGFAEPAAPSPPAVPSELAEAPGPVQRDLNSGALCSVPTPAAPESKAGAAGGPQTRGARSSAESRVLTFPLGPPPPPPLGLAFELSAQPSGRSAGAQDRCHGRARRAARARNPVSNTLTFAAPAAAAAKGLPQTRERLTSEDRVLARSRLLLPRRPPSAAGRGAPGAARAPRPAPRSAPGRAAAGRGGARRAGRCLPGSPRLPGGLPGSALPARGSDFGTSASPAAAATLKPITQGACLFAAAKSN